MSTPALVMQPGLPPAVRRVRVYFWPRSIGSVLRRRHSTRQRWHSLMPTRRPLRGRIWDGSTALREPPRQSCKWWRAVQPGSVLFAGTAERSAP